MAEHSLEFAACFVDGACRGNPGPSGVGVVVQDRSGGVIAELKEFIGEGTNNIAEYRAVLLALKELKKLGVKGALINMDSELVVNQLTGNYRVKNENLIGLMRQVRQAEQGFSFVNYNHVPREKNKAADKLANVAINLAV